MSRAISIAVLVGIVALAAVYNVRSRDVPPPVPGSHSATAGQQGVPVTVTVARRRTMTRALTLVGIVRAQQQASISPKVPARVRQVLVRDGEQVRRGQPLVLLDMGDMRAQIAGAQAGVAAARAQYSKAVEGKTARRAELDSQVAQAQGGLDLARARLRQAELGVRLTDTAARSDAARADAGVKQAEAGLRQAEAGYAQASEAAKRVRFLYTHGGVARADLEGAEAQADMARSQRDAARAGLEQARAGLRPATEGVPLRHDVSEADVRAARAGVRQAGEGLRSAVRGRQAALGIADRDIESAAAQVRQALAGHAQAAAAIGSATLVSPIDGVATAVAAHAGEYAQPGMAMLTVVSARSAYLEVAAPARDASSLRVGQAARIEPGADPGAVVDGAIASVSSVAGPDDRTVTVRVALRGDGERLVPGSTAKASIEVARSRATVTVPIDALRNEGGTTFAWVVLDGKARRRNLNVGVLDGPYAEILSGIAEGETVVVMGPDTLENGTPVYASSG